MNIWAGDWASEPLALCNANNVNFVKEFATYTLAALYIAMREDEEAGVISFELAKYGSYKDWLAA